MNIFDFKDYKSFINQWIRQRPGRGRGEARKMAEYLRIHSTMISHILNGHSNFNFEQGEELISYLGLSEIEAEYFLELLHFERAGSVALKNRIQKRIESIRKRATQLKERLTHNQERKLSDADLGIYYSSWHYAAIRLLVSIGVGDRRAIAAKLKLSPKKINEAVEFLLRTGVCQSNERGELISAPSLTHLGSDSPHVWRHHANWRLKAFERHFDLSDEELIYTAPLTISLEDMKIFREQLVKLISDLKTTVEKTKPELLACLNIDWILLR